MLGGSDGALGPLVQHRPLVLGVILGYLVISEQVCGEDVVKLRWAMCACV